MVIASILKFVKSVTARRRKTRVSGPAYQESGAREVDVDRLRLGRKAAHDYTLRISVHQFALDPDLAIVIRRHGDLFAGREFLRLVSGGGRHEARRGVHAVQDTRFLRPVLAGQDRPLIVAATLNVLVTESRTK
jgi:hypothetical protein